MNNKKLENRWVEKAFSYQDLLDRYDDKVKKECICIVKRIERNLKL